MKNHDTRVQHHVDAFVFSYLVTGMKRAHTSRLNLVFQYTEATSAWLTVLKINRNVDHMATLKQVPEPSTVSH